MLLWQAHSEKCVRKIYEFKTILERRNVIKKFYPGLIILLRSSHFCLYYLMFLFFCEIRFLTRICTYSLDHYFSRFSQIHCCARSRILHSLTLFARMFVAFSFYKCYFLAVKHTYNTQTQYILRIYAATEIFSAALMRKEKKKESDNSSAK